MSISNTYHGFSAMQTHKKDQMAVPMGSFSTQQNDIQQIL